MGTGHLSVHLYSLTQQNWGLTGSSSVHLILPQQLRKLQEQQQQQQLPAVVTEAIIRRSSGKGHLCRSQHPLPFSIWAIPLLQWPPEPQPHLRLEEQSPERQPHLHLHLKEQPPEPWACVHLEKWSPMEPQPPTTPTGGRGTFWSTGFTYTNWSKRWVDNKVRTHSTT